MTNDECQNLAGTNFCGSAYFSNQKNKATLSDCLYSSFLTRNSSFINDGDVHPGRARGRG